MWTLSALIIDEKEDFRVSLELLRERERERASQRGAARVHIGRVAQTTGPAGGLTLRRHATAEMPSRFDDIWSQSLPRANATS